MKILQVIPPFYPAQTYGVEKICEGIEENFYSNQIKIRSEVRIAWM